MVVKTERTEIGIDELASFCKRKGFVYPSGEIYGGLAGFWDYGPLGVELAKNIKDSWWAFHVRNREDVEGVDGSIITNPKVWEASGHVENFVDYIVYDKKKKERFKVDAHEVKNYENKAEYEIEGKFNPMFETKVGPGKGSESYLRPETAQSIFVNFRNVFDNARGKLPFGIAQIGKAFRNEIAPREFLFRSREFEQMEIEYFTKPGSKCPYMDELPDLEITFLTEGMQKENREGEKMKILDSWKKGMMIDWHAYWLAQEFSWFLLLGANPENFRARQHISEEKSHYAIDTWDLEYKFPMGWRELQGFANRGIYDLTQHQEKSGKSFEIFDEDSKSRLIPEVACEPSLGVGRAFIAFMLDAYEFDKKRENVVLHLSPKLAPYKAAVMPVISKGEIADAGYELYKELKEELNVFYDKSGSIGRRYSRQDEIGTPYCIAIDGQTIEDKTVTIRDRDSTRQIRVHIKDLIKILKDLLKDKVVFENAGKIVETRIK
ncbi:glycine--tRNA ligase [Candidatus Pacearchaeota archaeon CG1_02_32_132]|nr:MAG: glycine--tRNA ligase [Candidatus Pacearchaeota archaeon CG1_02_32_132]